MRKIQIIIQQLNSANFLAQTYAQLYASDKEFHDDYYKHVNYDSQATGEQKQYSERSVKGKMIFYLALLEEFFQRNDVSSSEPPPEDETSE